ncbi:MAG: hypothetical protein ACRD9W_14255 [Terriglobia bacterium]
MQQRQHICGGEEAGQRNREDSKKSGENREHDSLLSDVPDPHPGFSGFLSLLPAMLARFDCECNQRPAGKFRGAVFRC